MKTVFLCLLNSIILLQASILSAIAQTNRQEYFILDSITSADPALNSLLNTYIDMILDSDSIKDESQIREIFQIRKKVIVDLRPVLENYFFQNYQTFDDLFWQKIEQSIFSLGIGTIYNEGTFSDLAEIPIIENKVDELCSEEYKLYLSFQYAFYLTLGAEYPYFDLEGEIQMLTIGEEFLTKYANSPFFENIRDRFYSSLHIMTDVHIVKDNLTKPYYVIGGMTTDVFPNATDIAFHKSFIERYPESKFKGIVERILLNTSEIEIDSFLQFKEVYVISVLETNDLNIANETVRNYLMVDKDIPHIITYYSSNSEIYSVCYRFYSDKKKAKDSFRKFSKTHTKAKLLHINSSFALVK